MFNHLLKQGDKRALPPNLLKLKNFIALSTAFYLITASLTFPEPILHRSIAFGLFYSMIFLSFTSPGSKSSNFVPFYDLLLSFASIAVSIYIALNLDRLIYRTTFVDQVLAGDLFFGLLTIFLILEGTRRVVGPWLPGLVMISLAYIFWGQYIASRFGHRGFSLHYIVDGLFLSTYGVWGSIMGTATGQLMVFLMFGAFFLKSGAGDFLFDFVSSIAGSSKGGVAKIAVISSALFGMISGGPLSNVSTTGTLTIPAMKKKGYSPEFAAATESCASVGGIFMPPIMGSVVFIMSEVVGIPYATIAKRALLPAIIYFSAIFFVIDARSRKLSMEGISLEDRKPLLLLIRKGANFFIPLTYLVIRLLSGISPARVGLESILVILITSVFMKKSMLKIKIIFETLKSAINRGIMIISTMASCGILIGIINITGITAKFSSFLMSMVDLSVFLTLILVMLITLFLGLAMNITSSYLITAVICAPILIRYGFEPLSVHMFILFFSTMATITPPVALTAFTAATIAETSPMKVAFQAIKIGFVAYILPFVFVFNPAMLLSGTAFQISFSFASAFLGVYFLAMGTEGWFINSKINLVLRILLVTAGILSMFGKIYFTGIAIILVALIYLFKNHIMEGSYEKI